MIEEHKTHYSDKRHCERLGSEVFVEQLKGSGMMIVRCAYNHLDNTCYVDFDPNDRRDIIHFEPKDCLFSNKLVKIVKD